MLTERAKWIRGKQFDRVMIVMERYFPEEVKEDYNILYLSHDDAIMIPLIFANHYGR